MVVIVKFFNDALIFFSQSFAGRRVNQHANCLGNLVKAITTGTEGFAEAQKNLDVAVREYDQAVLHLAVRMIASTMLGQFTLLILST